MSEAPHRGYALYFFFLLAVLAMSTLFSCWGNDLEHRFSKGLEFLYDNHYEDAESHFLMFAREMARSDNPDAKHWQAKALFQIGRIDHLYLDQPHRAVSQLRKALKLYPKAAFAFDARKEIADIFYDRLMDYRTSAMEYERLVHDFSEHKGIDTYQYRVAQSYFLVRDFDQARTEARLLLSKWPDSRSAQEARLLIANSYYLQNRLSDAIKAHRDLLDSNPDIPIRARSLFELGICYQDLGEKQKAEEAFIAALKDHPRPDLVQMQLAALRERIKNEDQATKPLAYSTEPAVSSSSQKAKTSIKRTKNTHDTASASPKVKKTDTKKNSSSSKIVNRSKNSSESAKEKPGKVEDKTASKTPAPPPKPAAAKQEKKASTKPDKKAEKQKPQTPVDSKPETGHSKQAQ